MAQSRFLDDPRRRNLAILGGAALIMVMLAITSLWREAGFSAPRESHDVFFPDLNSPAHEITLSRVRIQSSKGVIDVVFKPERGWVVASHEDYPASYDEVKSTAIGLSQLTTIEQKTARPDWFSYVDLQSPDKGGNGKEITLWDDKGRVVASVITGKTEDIGDPTGGVGLFVRRPGENQTWLVRSVFEPKSDAGDWLDKQVMSIDRARVAETDVYPLSGPAFVVRRTRQTDADFTLVDMPKDRALAYEGAPDGVGAAVVDFSFDDVKPAKNFDFSNPAHTARVVTKTFDGLTVSTSVTQQGQDYWATLSAEGANPDAQKEARAINAHASGWAYKLPSYKGQQFMTGLESLLKPKAGTTAAAQTH